MPEVFEYHQGDSPLLISFPHDGVLLPGDLKSRFTTPGQNNMDCDWFISDLYNFIHDADISFIKPLYSRYVVDLNRSPDGELLYPGKPETGICPLTTFNSNPIYLEGEEPDKDEIRLRINAYWRPYHRHVRNELIRIKAIHGHAFLWDAHSIRGEVPELFEGVLPDLNFGTDDGITCDEQIVNGLIHTVQENADYSAVLNGRFKGGYITRHYGDPRNDIHSIQLEINQDTYLKRSESPTIDHEKAGRLSGLLHQLIRQLEQ